jgi:hypothetical protein
MNITYLTKVCNLTIATLSTMAELNSILKNDDLKIVIKGSFLYKLSQIYIKVENRGHEIDTANVSVDITLKHIIRNEYVSAVKKHYKIPCNWSVTKEIGEFWDFLIGGRVYTRGLFKLEVVVQGINDDIYLYKKEVTYGFIFNKLRVRMIPRL